MLIMEGLKYASVTMVITKNNPVPARRQLISFWGMPKLCQGRRRTEPLSAVRAGANESSLRSPWAGTRYVLYISFYRFFATRSHSRAQLLKRQLLLLTLTELGRFAPGITLDRQTDDEAAPRQRCQPRRLTYLGSPMRRHFVPASFLLLLLTALEGRLCADSHCT